MLDIVYTPTYVLQQLLIYALRASDVRNHLGARLARVLLSLPQQVDKAGRVPALAVGADVVDLDLDHVGLAQQLRAAEVAVLSPVFDPVATAQVLEPGIVAHVGRKERVAV